MKKTRPEIADLKCCRRHLNVGAYKRKERS